MAVTVYRSTDSSAPVLHGNAGSQVTCLDAILVNGYGSKAVAGWTKEFSATNGATYRAPSGVRHYFHFDDNSPNGTALGKEAQFRGSETATAFQTGTGFFPSTAQIALGSGLVVRKSSATGTGAIPWVCVADERTCYFFALTGDTAATYLAFGFGEFYSLLTSTDNYRSIVVGRTGVNSGTNTSDTLDKVTVTVSTSAGHYLPRTYTGLGTSLFAGKFGDAARSGGATAVGAGGISGIEAVSGAIEVAPVHIADTGAIRGRMRGFFQLCHTAATFTDGDTITGSGAYAGRTFLVLKTTGSSGCYCIDITGPWETN